MTKAEIICRQILQIRSTLFVAPSCFCRRLRSPTFALSEVRVLPVLRVFVLSICRITSAICFSRFFRFRLQTASISASSRDSDGCKTNLILRANFPIFLQALPKFSSFQTILNSPPKFPPANARTRFFDHQKRFFQFIFAKDKSSPDFQTARVCPPEKPSEILPPEAVREVFRSF